MVFKRTEAYNYLHSDRIGKVLLKKHSEFIFLKAAVEFSHSVSQAKHAAWMMLEESEVMETDGCSSIAGLGKSCSHAVVILCKIFINPNIYFSVTAASHTSLRSPFLGMAWRAQDTDVFVEVVDVQHKKFLKKA